MTKKTILSNFETVLTSRRAIKFFDENAPVPSEVITKGIEHAILAPTSLNLQHWEFYRIESDEMKKKMPALCLNQSSATTAGAFVVIVARPDLVIKRSEKILQMSLAQAENPNSGSMEYVKTMYQKIVPAIHRPITACIFNCISSIKNIFNVGMVTGTMRTRYIEAHSSCAMAGNNFMLSMTAQGFSTCPMMGIDVRRVKKLLNLPKSADINMVIAIGKPHKKRSVYGERTRLDSTEVSYTL